MHFAHPGSSTSRLVHQRSSSAIFQKDYFWAPMHRKTILGNMGGQNQVKDTKSHQVQFFKKSNFEVLCIEKPFWATCDVKIKSRLKGLTSTKIHIFLYILKMMTFGDLDRILTPHHVLNAFSVHRSSKTHFLKICTWWPFVTVTWFWPPMTQNNCL